MLREWHVYGEILLSRCHDHTVDLPAEISTALDLYAEAAKTIPSTVAGLRGRLLGTGEAAGILMNAGRKKLVGWAAIGRVDAEFRDPTYPEHGHGTSWALLNAFTYAARPNISGIRQMEVFNAFQRMLPTQAPYKAKK